jgi:hypothetical protein
LGLAPKIVNERVDADVGNPLEFADHAVSSIGGTKRPSILQPAASVLCLDRDVFIARQSGEGCNHDPPIVR